MNNDMLVQAVINRCETISIPSEMFDYLEEAINELSDIKLKLQLEMYKHFKVEELYMVEQKIN